MVAVYIAPEVEQVLQLHPYLQDTSFSALPIREQIDTQATTLFSAHRNGDTRIRMQVFSWWPSASGKSLDEAMEAPFARSDAVLTICREYGFVDWQSVESLQDLPPNIMFEQALDVMLSGDITLLQTLIDETPELTMECSRYGHQATLLHYLGANGVESYRQKTPLNAVELAQLLIAKGASKEATANMYGGGQTPFALASSSAHPHGAGISAELNAVLQLGSPIPHQI